MTEHEVVADYDIRSPASRTLLTVLGTLLFVALMIGLVLGTSLLKRNTKVSTSVVEIGNSAQIVIDSGSADLRLVQGDPDVVKVTSRITSGLRKTDFEIGRRGDEIKIASECQTWLSPGCGVSTTLEIPEGFPVVIRTGSGDVVADSIDEGALTILTGSGDITGKQLKVDELFATSKSGDITASFKTQPFGLKATTTSGDIAAVIPTGKRTYHVMAKSKSGDVSSKVDSDADGKGLILAKTSSGDISLRAE